MAARFWVGQSGGGNYNSTDWALTTGGTTGQIAPTSSDDVHFDGAGTFGNTNCTVTATAAALSVVFTSGYTATITINTTIVWTISGNFTDVTNHTWVVNGTGSLAVNATSTIASGGKTFPGPVTFSGANTKTLNGDWTISGILTVSSVTTINHTTAEILNVAGGYTCNGTTSGTITLNLTGGTWSGTSGTQCNVTIAGNVTISGTVGYNTGTLTYTSGTVTTTSSTLNIVTANTTLNTNGITWANITIGATLTLTINSLLSVSGTFTINAGVNATFAGTSGFSVATFSCLSAAAQTQTLKNGVTYTITTSFSAFASRTGAILLFTSDDGTLKATITLNNGASCNVLASFTRIDASNGRPILSFNGTITTCTNIFAYTDVQVPPPTDSRRFGRRKIIYNRAKTVVYQIPS